MTYFPRRSLQKKAKSSVQSYTLKFQHKFINRDIFAIFKEPHHTHRYWERNSLKVSLVKYCWKGETKQLTLLLFQIIYLSVKYYLLTQTKTGALIPKSYPHTHSQDDCPTDRRFTVLTTAKAASKAT